MKGYLKTAFSSFKIQNQDRFTFSSLIPFTLNQVKKKPVNDVLSTGFLN